MVREACALGYCEDLVQDLTRRERPPQSLTSRGAETASHAASHLRGDAERGALAVGYVCRLDESLVGRTKRDISWCRRPRRLYRSGGRKVAPRSAGRAFRGPHARGRSWRRPAARAARRASGRSALRQRPGRASSRHISRRAGEGHSIEIFHIVGGVCAGVRSVDGSKSKKKCDIFTSRALFIGIL